VDYDDFYRRLFAPIVAIAGPEDPATLTSIVGFSAGGPVSLSSFRGKSDPGCVTYATCELSQYTEQGTDASPHFELFITTNEEEFASALLTGLGALSLEASLGHHHTVDTSDIVPAESNIAGVVLEEFARVDVDGEPYALLRCIGLTGAELAQVRRRGATHVLGLLTGAGIYPRTPVPRVAVV
jgi:hypothetical protein